MLRILHPHPNNLVPADELAKPVPRKRGKELIGKQRYISGYIYCPYPELRLKKYPQTAWAYVGFHDKPLRDGGLTPAPRPMRFMDDYSTKPRKTVIFYHHEALPVIKNHHKITKNGTKHFPNP